MNSVYESRYRDSNNTFKQPKRTIIIFSNKIHQYKHEKSFECIDVEISGEFSNLNSVFQFPAHESNEYMAIPSKMHSL